MKPESVSDLIYRLHNWCNEKHGDDIVQEAQELMSEAAEALAAPPEVQRWISVDDQLPETTGWCSVWTVNRDGRVCASEFWGEEKQFWPPNGKGEYWASQEDDITHWMPMELPSPPQSNGQS